MEFVDEAGPGDFVYVPPYVPHQELNARKDQPVEAVIVRSGQEPVVVNLDIPSPEDAPTLHETIRFTPRPESANPKPHIEARLQLLSGTRNSGKQRRQEHRSVASRY